MTKEFVMLYNEIEVHLNNPKNQKIFIDSVRSYYDENSEIYASSGLEKQPIFKMKFQNDVYNALGVTENRVIAAVSSSEVIKNEWKVFSNPIYIAITMLIRYFVKKKNAKLTEASYMLLTGILYSAIYKVYFPIGVAKNEVMTYTINNLSNKFDIKKLGSLLESLKKLSSNNHENSVNFLIKDDDLEIFKYPMNLRTRINAFVKRIKNEFDQNYKKGKYINIDKEEIEHGDDTLRNERETDSSVLSVAAQNYVIWFSINRIDDAGLRTAANISLEISVNSLRPILNDLKNDSSGKLEEIASDIFELLAQHQKDNSLKAVCSNKFLPFVISIFGKSNTSDKSILRIKKNLDILLSKYSEKFNQTQREATKINYKKAILVYIAYTIQKSRCK